MSTDAEENAVKDAVAAAVGDAAVAAVAAVVGVVGAAVAVVGDGEPCLKSL